MNNRIINKMTGLGSAAFLLAAAILGNWGQRPDVWAAGVDNTGISLTQKAVWTDEDNFRAEITMDVRGLLAYKNNQPKNAPGPQMMELLYLPDRKGEAGAGWELMQLNNWEIPPEVVGEDAYVYDSVQWDVSGSNPNVVNDGETGTEETEPGETESQGTESGETEPVETEPGEIETESGESGTGEMGAGESPAYGVYAAAGEVVCLVNYISEYFELDSDTPPAGWSAETIPVHSQKGEQTVITKITYPIDLQSFTEDTLSLRIPVKLREEYRTPGEDVRYPVSQDAPLEKDRTGTGAFLELRGEGEGNSQLLAQTPSPSLDVPGVQADFTLGLKSAVPGVKAGESVTYELKLTNSGNVALSGIRLSPAFVQKNLTALWESAEGLEIEGSQAILTALGKGETRTLNLRVQLPEEMEGNLDLTIAGKAFRPGTDGEIIDREATLHIPVNPLKVDFTVEKTADRTIAVPGDTITYQICIRNTGERTLHSVVSTERLLSAGVHAQFVEKAGVILSAGKNQALISQIAPGEAFALEAVVTLPQNFASQELINQVTVVTRETGTKSVQSQAGVTIQAPGTTVSPTPYPTQAVYQSGAGTKSGGSLGRSTSSYPKTADPSRPGLLAALMLGSFAVAAGVFGRRKQKRNH